MTFIQIFISFFFFQLEKLKIFIFIISLEMQSTIPDLDHNDS